jgi:hypothetical protein
MTGSSRWLVVVHPGRPDLYHHLLRRLEDLPYVEVILDRRRGERRLRQAGTGKDLRRRDRRQPPAAKAREQWALFRYCLVQIEEPGAGEPLDFAPTRGARVAR